jgi:hypothetical protein
VADADWATGGDLREKLDPHRVGESTEYLDGDVPRLGDDPWRCKRSRLEDGERAGDRRFWLGHGRSLILKPDKKWLKITNTEYRLGVPRLCGGADAAMRLDLQACAGFCRSPMFLERSNTADERREQL